MAPRATERETVPAVLSFAKYEGLGNDFIVVETGDERDLPAESAPRLCDRHFGIGADGVILLLPARADDCAVRMRVINADGSVPEMCGNGVRCASLHIARARAIREGTVRVDTDAGPRACLVEDARREGMVTVDMGMVRVIAERTLQVEQHSLPLTIVDAGNPHAVLFGRFDRSDVEKLGPLIATHTDFARGTNVEFAHVDRDAIDLLVLERGAGMTLACGTGACATVAAASAKGLVQTTTPISVRLPGGTLSVKIERDGRATLRGPARHVFSGTIAI
jgi:diaminopimelate epimerase